MAIKYKNHPIVQDGDPTKTFGFLKERVQSCFALPASVEVRVGVSRTSLHHNGVSVELPFGIADIKNHDELVHGPLGKTYNDLGYILSGVSDLGPPATTSTPAPVALDAAQVTDPSQLTDEEWIIHMAKNLFPGTIHLHKANELYQPVLGTGSGSIYKTCFIGEDLKIAARIKKHTISFRATNASNQAPTGQAQWSSSASG